jgi:hydrogenase maturation protease
LKTLVLGLGNPILTDDGVGIYVAREVAARWMDVGVDFREASVGGLRLLETIAGYDRVILADAIQTRDGQPGDIHRLTAAGLWSSRHAGSTHDLSFGGALILGRSIGMSLPADESITIVAVEVEDVLTVSEGLTPAVAAAIPAAAEVVLSLL